MSSTHTDTCILNFLNCSTFFQCIKQILFPCFYDLILQTLKIIFQVLSSAIVISINNTWKFMFSILLSLGQLRSHFSSHILSYTGLVSSPAWEFQGVGWDLICGRLHTQLGNPLIWLPHLLDFHSHFFLWLLCLEWQYSFY